MGSKIKIRVEGIEKEITTGETYINIIKNMNLDLSMLIGIRVNNEITSIDEIPTGDVEIKLIKYNEKDGNKIYVRGLMFVLVVAVKEVLGVQSDVFFRHSLDKGIYCEIKSDKKIDEEVMLDIKNKAIEIIKEDIVFEEGTTDIQTLIEYYREANMLDKIDNLMTVTSEIVKLYKLKDYYNYFYGQMPYSTRYINKFEITYLQGNNFVLRFPVCDEKGSIPEYKHHESTLKVFKEYVDWMQTMKVDNIGKLNQVVSHGEIGNFIRINEALQTEMLSDISKELEKKKKDIKLILLAGPSSSGKTTTANKISIYLKTKGFNPYILGTDDYFLDRDETPLDEEGNYDFERLEAIDLKLFNNHLTKLLNGEEVSIPSFNFILGKKEYHNRLLKLEERDILIIEGLHTLNEKLTKSIKRDNKYKIYISPFTPLNIDRHNYISTTDIRLLRRIVRDNRTRGANVVETLRRWKKVRSGEEEYVFPYQDDVDYVLNSALLYEVGVLKVYVEPLLFDVESTSEYYGEARRLIMFLKNFLPIAPDDIPDNSIIREFIGGSCFK